MCLLPQQLSQKQIIQQLKQRMKKPKLGGDVQSVITREALGGGGGALGVGGGGLGVGGALAAGRVVQADTGPGPALGPLGVGGLGSLASLRIPSPHHGAQRDGDKKIIIEDFVEVKRLTASTQPPSGASAKVSVAHH